MNNFGTEFRKARTDAGLTMGQMARALGVSVSSVSDMEHNRRPPPSQDRLANLERMLPNDVVAGLTTLAAHVKQMFQLSGKTPMELEVGAALERSWGAFSDDQLKQISDLVNGWRSPPSEDD